MESNRETVADPDSSDKCSKLFMEKFLKQQIKFDHWIA